MLCMTSTCRFAQFTFGELLRAWRRNQGLSQGDFGALLIPKATQSAVSYWENGTRCPSFKFLGQILVITGIPAQLVVAPAPSAVSPSPGEGGRGGGRGGQGVRG